MVLKDVSYLKRGNYVYIYGHWLNMEFSQEFDTPYWKIFTENDFFLKFNVFNIYFLFIKLILINSFILMNVDDFFYFYFIM